MEGRRASAVGRRAGRSAHQRVRRTPHRRRSVRVGSAGRAQRLLSTGAAPRHRAAFRHAAAGEGRLAGSVQDGGRRSPGHHTVHRGQRGRGPGEGPGSGGGSGRHDAAGGRGPVAPRGLGGERSGRHDRRRNVRSRARRRPRRRGGTGSCRWRRWRPGSPPSPDGRVPTARTSYGSPWGCPPTTGGRRPWARGRRRPASRSVWTSGSRRCPATTVPRSSRGPSPRPGPARPVAAVPGGVPHPDTAPGREDRRGGAERR